MDKFTLAVANSLIKKIADLRKHKVDVDVLIKRREDATNNTFVLQGWKCNGLDLLAEFLPDSPAKLLDFYTREIAAQIGQMEYSFQQLNADSAEAVNQRFNLGIV